MGAELSVHRGRYRRIWVGAVLVAVAMGIPFVIQDAPQLLFFAVPAAVLSAILATLTTPRCIILFEDGVERRGWIRAPSRLHFGDCQSVYWEISALGGRLVTGATMKLVDGEGRSVRIGPGVEDLETLVTAIDRGCVRPVRQAAFDAFNDGEELTFGPIVLSNAGVRFGDVEYAWREITAVELSLPRLHFHFRDGAARRTFHLDRVPFPNIMTELLDRADVEVWRKRLIVTT